MVKVALLTAGGLAPCLSASLGFLIQRYHELIPDVEIIMYIDGYMGLLLGKAIKITPDLKEKALAMTKFGGSMSGNSRVKFTNVKDCVAHKYVKEGEIPLEVACKQLIKDGINILHTIGGDDTNTAAADLAAFLAKQGIKLTCVGLPKTIDNDVFPIAHTMGAWSAAENGAIFFENVVAEGSANPRHLLIHEVMGRSCGYLTAATAHEYMSRLAKRDVVEGTLMNTYRLSVHAVYIPEMNIDIAKEAARLREIMDKNDSVNIFLSEGAGLEAIVAEMEKSGEKVPRDAFNHVRLDAINPGQWFGKQFAALIGAEKCLIQKSGYYARSGPAHDRDMLLIKGFCDYAIECALKGISGVVGHDTERNNALSCIAFERIKGGKRFDVGQKWFQDLLKKIGQV